MKAGRVALAALLAVMATAGRGAAQSAACLLIELPSGRTLEVAQPGVLDSPVLPGSLAKIATLAAALDSGVITPQTLIACRRQLSVDGHRFTCSHPDLGRPLTPADALGHSCNYYFASVASRLRRDAFNSALVALGLPPAGPDVPMTQAALGLAGARATPRQLLSAFVRLTSVSTPVLSARARPVVMDGLGLAAREGTARSLGDGGVAALAKTGTSPMPGGGYLGLVVAVAPSVAPSRAIVVAVPGGSGMDAAAVAATRLRASLAPVAGKGISLRVGLGGPGGYDVQRIELEDYVAGVVAAEAAPGSGVEALRALAIVARTFAWTGRARHAREGFDLCALTHCQVFKKATGATRSAAAATAGEVLLYAGAPAQLFYSASCGGRSERPSAVWPGVEDAPFLVSRAEPECRDVRWTSELRADRLLSVLRSSGWRGDVIRDLRIVQRSATGRVSRLAIDGLEPPEIDGEAFRLLVGRLLGWQLVKSTAFDLERTAGGYRVRGTGSGHGVGLCLLGAARMAAAGRSATEILAAYYPGTVRGKLPQKAKPGSGPDRNAGDQDVGRGSSPVGSAGRQAVGRGFSPAGSDKPRLEILLPAGEERERARVEDVARRAVGHVAGKGGLAVPETLHIALHPTVEAYARATGLPWWTAGATRGARIDLLPPAVLRERGLFDRAISHEVAHVMIAGRLDGRPLWVREAAAMYLSGESDGDPVVANRACPSDEAFTRSRSAASLRNAYSCAAACFAAQLAAGRQWHEVR